MSMYSPPYVLVLLAGGRKWINQNHRLFWMERSRRAKAWRELAHVRALGEHIPHLNRAHVICELRFADDRRRDPDNWSPTAKAVVDGLVDAGVFPDDDHRHVIGPDMRIGEKVIGANVGMRVLIYPRERP